jgi:Fe2+ transport system protein FeoA
LAAISPGQEVLLVAYQGGRRFQHRLAEMGLVPGARFRVISRGRPGPFLISLRGARLMLGHGMVDRLLVRPT